MTKLLRTFAPLLLVATLGCAPSSGDDEPDLGPACPYVGQAPVEEVCNAFDDDCDGVMDEGVCDDPCGAFDETPLPSGR
ncbi:MAG: hypothetical protein IPN77_00900 [Sandaracinaceae bacterium]|jgi:hypothetical protein|nr:hypothetical protein [Sandaracinaceae bacterium]